MCMESQRVYIITGQFGANCDKHEPKHNNCVVSHAQYDMMRTRFVCLCVGYLSVQPVCVCVCICSVFKGRLSQHAAVSGEKVIHFSPFCFTNAPLPCTFSTSLLFTSRNKRTHTTWCLINQHFRNIIQSTTDHRLAAPSHQLPFCNLQCKKALFYILRLLITFLAPKAQFSFMQSFYALLLTYCKLSVFDTVLLQYQK